MNRAVIGQAARSPATIFSQLQNALARQAPAGNVRALIDAFSAAALADRQLQNYVSENLLRLPIAVWGGVNRPPQSSALRPLHTLPATSEDVQRARVNITSTFLRKPSAIYAFGFAGAQRPFLIMQPAPPILLPIQLPVRGLR